MISFTWIPVPTLILASSFVHAKPLPSTAKLSPIALVFPELHRLFIRNWIIEVPSFSVHFFWCFVCFYHYPEVATR